MLLKNITQIAYGDKGIGRRTWPGLLLLQRSMKPAARGPGRFRLFPSKSALKRAAGHRIERPSIKTLKRSLKIFEYSGGNQQKTVIARALAQNLPVIFFNEPARGGDVGAIPQIHGVIRNLAEEGKAVVMISSYLPQVMAVSDCIPADTQQAYRRRVPGGRGKWEENPVCTIH